MKKKEIGIIVSLVLLIPIIGFFVLYYNKIAPGVYIAGINMSGKSRHEAEQLISKSIKTPESLKLIIQSSETQEFQIPLSDISFAYSFNETVDNAYKIGKSGDFFKDTAVLISLINNKAQVPLSYRVDEASLQQFLSTIAGQATTEAVYPKIQLANNKIVIEQGKKGFDVNIQAITKQVEIQLAEGRDEPIIVELVEIDPTLTESELDTLRARAEKIIDKSITVKFEFDTTTLSKQTLLELLDTHQGANLDNLKMQVEAIAKKHNREAINPVFVFEESRVKEFQPAKPGVLVREQELAEKIAEGINTLENTDTKVVEINTPVDQTDPKITTSEVNDLGIKELIGRGTSKYRGSIASRVHNVNLAATRINGVLIPPGETFSFNNALGDVSKLTGYKEAYVIQSGKTVLGDGGGVCQVSSTLFRAILNAGLPIVERRAHSYRVGYYEQESFVGLDATVYSPTTDFKFKNDTPAHILIQTISDPKNYSLIFEIYGTSDGRVATITKPVVTDVVAPADDLYVDDPTLATGVVKQVEHKAWGAKSTFYYEVKRGDEVIYQKTFVSTYRPWQAVYMRGTGPIQ